MNVGGLFLLGNLFLFAISSMAYSNRIQNFRDLIRKKMYYCASEYIHPIVQELKEQGIFPVTLEECPWVSRNKKNQLKHNAKAMARIYPGGYTWCSFCDTWVCLAD